MKTKPIQMNLMIFILCLSLVNVSSLLAQTTKTTKADGLWSDPNTWTGGVIPDASNKATINNDVIIDMDVNILSLTISASSSLTFDTLSPRVFTVADEIVVNGLFTVDRNKVSPLKHIVEVGADFYGPGNIDFYEKDGDVVDLVFIGNSNSTLRDIADVTGIGGNGKFGGLKVDKTIKSAVVTLKKSLNINSGPSSSLQSNVTVVKGILDFDSSYVSAGDNTNKLQINSLGQLFIASLNVHSGDGFEEYAIHLSSTVKYYNGDNYEMTKGWTAFNGEFGNFIVSGGGEKYFGDSVVIRTITGDFTVDAGANYNVNNDSVVVHGLASINGTLSSDNKPGYLIFDSLVTVYDDGEWQATMNDMFVFKNGLTVSDKADFSSGTGDYIFTARDQEIALQDTILNLQVDNINLLSKDSLTCNVLQGTGTLINNYMLDFTGQAIQCNLNLDSANNIVVYSNDNPVISPLNYEILQVKGTGTSSLGGNVIIKKSLIKNNDGYISLGNYDLILDTLALLQLSSPAEDRMMVTDGNGSLMVRSKTADRFRMVYPVGTLIDTAVYTPFEITNLINHPGGEKYLSVRTRHDYHPGMEDTTGLMKYWAIETNMLSKDSIGADIRFVYHDTEVGGIENNYEVRCWTGNEPWIEPENWSIDALQNEITVLAVNNLSLDWTAGDSTAITSKIDELVYSVDEGVYYNSQTLAITTSTSDVSIYYTLNDAIPDNMDSLYTTPIAIDSAMTVSAIAYKDGWQNSDVKTASYTLKVDTVKFDTPSGIYKGKQYFELTSFTLNTEIHYTLDGTDPNELSILYTAPIEIDTTTTIKAIGFKEKYVPSPISIADYIIVYDTVDTPKFNLADGVYYSDISVEIRTDTVNTQIYYSFGDTIPNMISGRLYITAMSIGQPCTINAIAYKDDLIESNVTSVVYTFMVDTVKFDQPSGIYIGTQYIELSTSTSDAEIHYTLDGSDPDELSTLYTSPLEVDTTITIKTIGYKEKYQTSVISEASYIITTVSSIPEMVDNTDISIYPVPARNFIKIDLKNTGTTGVKLSLFNITGTLVYTDYFQSNSIIELILDEYKPGIYYLTLDMGNNQITRKLIKQ